MDATPVFFVCRAEIPDGVLFGTINLWVAGKADSEHRGMFAA